jgi:signal transduction histidine kinase
MLFPYGGGVSGALIRSIDWSRTPVGAVESWPASLRTMVQTLLHSRHPMFLWWGPELIQFYNDAYMPSFGAGKHPEAMGQRGRACWAEIWPIIGPQIEGVMLRGEPTWHEDALVPILRNGRIEEVYWTYGYSPVLDETGRVGGTLVVCTETTSRVIATRRQALLGRLALQGAVLDQPRQIIANAVAAFETSPQDIPFVAWFDGSGALQLASGVDGASSSRIAALAPRLAGLTAATRLTLEPAIPAGPWPEPVAHALAVPGFGGAVVFGLSARLPFDDAYRDFLLQLMESTRVAHERSEAFAEILRARDDRIALIADLEAANQAKDEFLALLGHELRNPLAPIVTALDLVRLRAGDASAREHQVIERHVRHLTRLVDDLLDVSRIARGKVELRRESVVIAEVVGKAIEMASPLIERREHRLDVELPREPVMWWGDPMRLAQVVSNLVTNAARYTNPHGQIRVTVARTQAGVEIAVTDNGNGIPAELLPRIFDRFVQGRRVFERSQGGLGIGLTLVKSLVELHDGTVAAYSDGPGQGSQFVVALPLTAPPALSASPAPPPAPPAAPSHAAGRPSRRVLVVDDNVDAANMMAELLGMKGHEVEVAYDALSALEVFSRFRPEVGVFDIGLPDVDGYELAQRVAAIAGSACRLIAVTGYGQERDSQLAREAGFHVHLAKPVKIDALLAAIAGE